MEWIIQDWAGNTCFMDTFNTFEDAEEFLSDFLGDSYDTDRQEYYIIDLKED